MSIKSGKPDLAQLFEQVAAGTLSPEDALTASRPISASVPASTASLDLGHSTLDLDRAERTGSAEVVFGQGKTYAQLQDITTALLDAGQRVLITRLDTDKLERLQAHWPAADIHSSAGIAALYPQQEQHPLVPTTTSIAVISAGTSDMSVAEEAALTAEFYGNPVLRIRDVGVAGLHRLLARVDEIRSARVVIVVAGMEGALPSVVGGLVDKPVIAVPTSVGYGAAFGGVAALLGMLNSCASGLSVVNIDNGFGAGFLANRMNRL